MGPCFRRDDQKPCRNMTAKGAKMEDLKVTANGYDFKPAQAAMQRYIDNNLLSGISWAVMVGRDLVDVNCVGWADKEAQTPLRTCLLYTSPSPRDRQKSRMPSSA